MEIKIDIVDKYDDRYFQVIISNSVNLTAFITLDTVDLVQT